MSGVPSWVQINAKCAFTGFNGLPPEIGTEHMRDPVVGVVYTISWIGQIRHQFCIGLAELDEDSAFDVRNFRPVHTIETDLEAHFRILLRQPVSDKEPAL
jgi:hypothetical protein